MMSFDEAVLRLADAEPRYSPDAYRFLRDALDDGVELFKKSAVGPGRHLTGGELLEAFRRRALAQFGPMAARVLKTWGVTRTEDVGGMVFRLVDIGALGKTEDDRIEDFSEVYSFEDAFVAPFRPASAGGTPDAAQPF